jgi:enamine deaminase RidA (YjgF/YER057c/UK114 family)
MTRPFLPALALIVTAACASSQRRGPPGGFPPPDISFTQPHAVAVTGVPQLPGFSTAVKVGNTVYLSGQVPLDSAGHLVGKGDLGAQAAQAFANMAHVIRAARGVPADLVQLTVYVVGYDTSAAGVVRRAVEPYVEPLVPPALTIVGVATLPEPNMLIAVDGIAVLRGQLPDKMRDRGR